MANIEQLKRRHKKAIANGRKAESILRDAYTYALPDRGYFDTLSNGQRTKRIYDSTAILGVGTYADKVQENMTPSWRKWFQLVPGSEVDDITKEQAQPLLDDITDILYDHINHSNFSTQINEAYQDVAISTGIITCEEGDGIESSLVFDSIPIEEIAFESSQSGIIDNIFKTFEIKIAEIEEVIQDAKLHPDMTKMLTADPSAEVTLVESITKNKSRTYDHVVYWPEKDFTVAEYIDDTSPYIVFRESVSSKGDIGMGRVIKLIYDIKVLNRIAEMDLQNAGLAIGGVWTAADDGVINPYTVVIEPGTIIPVASNRSDNPSLRPLDIPGNFQIAQLKMEQKQDLINKTLFGMPLGEISRTPVRTLGENQLRTADQFEMTSAAFSRFQTELLERLIKRMVDVLQKAGKIQPIRIDGKAITIKFTSPLAKQQDKRDVDVIVNYAATLQATGIPIQTVGAEVKFEEVPRFIAKQMGLPSELLRTPEEKNAYNLQQQQAAAAQQQLEGPANV